MTMLIDQDGTHDVAADADRPARAYGVVDCLPNRESAGHSIRPGYDETAVRFVDIAAEF